MALTNWSTLSDPQNKAWAMDVWKTARQNSFIMSIAGTGPNAAIQRITELKKGRKGTQAVITLVPDLSGDGTVGDYQLWDNEEALTAYEKTIQIDQLRHANRLGGRMIDQKTVVDFRSTSRDLLGFWLADRVDQIAIMTLAGWDFAMKTNGALRTGYTHNGTTYTATPTAGYALKNLAFQADVAAPTAKRSFQWDATNGLVAGSGVSTISTADLPTYDMLVLAKAYAKDRRLRSVRGGAGMELFHVFMHPRAVARLKLDSNFRNAVITAGVRGNANPFFSGAMVTVDGLVIHENTHVINTLGATAGTSTNVGDPGYKWGANADVDGSRTLILGAQALAFADLGAPLWEEESWDYGNQNGISIAKILGFLKPQFTSPIDGTTEDFGVITIDHAI